MSSTTQRVNAAEKDLEKFIKFLTLKSVQVIVQSRLGEKFQTQCNPLATGNDWFNIVINDHPDVAAETKHALAMKPGDSILQRLPISVEISLKTVDGDQMVLEVWSIDLQPLINDASNNRDTVDAAKGVANEQQLIKASHAIYNRMGILLKSLITLTRTTPAYKLSRRQCPDSYDIYYRIYVDRPQTHSLGEGYKQVRIGQLNTIVGTLSMSVAYRTKMTFTPTAANNRNAETNAIMLKSDHFRPNSDNLSAQNKSILAAGQKKGIGVCVPTEHRVIDLNKPMRPGAFADPNKLRQYTDNDFILPEVPPFEWLLRRVGTDCSTGSIESLNCKCEATPLGNGYQQHINISNNNYNNNNNIHVFNQNLQNNNNNNNNSNNNNNKHENCNGGNGGGLITMINTAGQLSLKSTTNATTTTTIEAPIKSLMVSVPPLSSTTCTAMPIAVSPQCDDDNLLKELNFPFATSTSHVDDLAKFYRDCYHAPPLRGLSEIVSECETTTNNCINSTNSSNISNNTNNNNSVVSCGASAAFAISADSAAVDDLSRQLEQFETSLEDYDKLVSQFGLSGSSSTGSRSSGGLQMSN